MKKTAFVIGATILVLAVYGFIRIEQNTVKVLEQVGIPADAAKDCIYYSFTGGYLNYPSVVSLKKIAAGQRADAVRDIVSFAKSYVQSPDFKKRYLEYRNNQKPEPPEAPKSLADQRKEQKGQLQASIKEMQDNMKNVPKDQRPVMQQTIDVMKQQLKEMDSPDNPMYSKQAEDMQQQMYQASMEEHKNRLAEWEKTYPPDAKPMLRTWLTDFLEATQDVDFSAALKDGEYGKKVFVNPAYESKSSQWKMCYRAGRDVVQAGRAAAQQWLTELR